MKPEVHNKLFQYRQRTAESRGRNNDTSIAKSRHSESNVSSPRSQLVNHAWLRSCSLVEVNVLSSINFNALTLSAGQLEGTCKPKRARINPKCSLSESAAGAQIEGAISGVFSG